MFISITGPLSVLLICLMQVPWSTVASRVELGTSDHLYDFLLGNESLVLSQASSSLRRPICTCRGPRGPSPTVHFHLILKSAFLIAWLLCCTLFAYKESEGGYCMILPLGLLDQLFSK